MYFTSYFDLNLFSFLNDSVFVRHAQLVLDKIEGHANENKSFDLQVIHLFQNNLKSWQYLFASNRNLNPSEMQWHFLFFKKK